MATGLVKVSFHSNPKERQCQRRLKLPSQFILIHTVKGFGIVNKAEIDVFSGTLVFFNGPTDVGNLISGSSALPDQGRTQGPCTGGSES